MRNRGVVVATLSLLTNPLLLMAISVTSLSERLSTELALERHIVVVYPQVVSEIAELWELQGTLFAL